MKTQVGWVVVGSMTLLSLFYLFSKASLSFAVPFTFTPARAALSSEDKINSGQTTGGDIASPQQAGELLSSDSQSIPENDINRFTNAIVLIKDFYVQPVNDKHILDNAIRGIVSGLDPHSEYLDSSAYQSLVTATSGEFGGIGIEVMPEYGILKIVSPLDETPADKAGIRAGDYIVAIDNKLVNEMPIQDAIEKMRGKAGSHIELTILRKGLKTPLKLKMQREVIHVASVKGKMLDNQFAYIRISQFQEPTAQLVHDMILNLKKKNNGQLNGVILDLRNNPGGLLETAAQIANYFLDSKKLAHQYRRLIVYTEGRLPETHYKVLTTGDDILKGAPMVVLINGGSASASEIVAGALQDYGRALIVGTQSFGKGSVQTIIPLDKLHALKLTTAFYHTPSGRIIQNIGIVPDIAVDNLEIAQNKKDDDLALVAPLKEFQLKNHLKSKTNSTNNALNQNLLDDNDLLLAKNDFQLFEAIKVLRTIYLSAQVKK